MRKLMLAVAILAALPSFAYGQSGFDGTWSTTGFNAPNRAQQTDYLSFRVNGTKVIGTISHAGAAARGVATIRDGVVDGDAITFTAVWASGERTVSFAGKLSGDTIAFTRSVKIHDENGNEGTGIFGAKGPMQFTAKRDANSSTGMEAQYGNWKLNLAKSHYEPDSPLPDVVPGVLSVSTLGDGKVKLVGVSVNPDGAPTFAETTVKADGNDYPYYTLASVDTLIAGGKPNVITNSIKVIDANTIEVTFKANGTVIRTASVSISQDGQTSTESAKDFDSSGNQIGSFVEVYERIP